MGALLPILTTVAGALGLDTLGGLITGLTLQQGPSFHQQIEELTAKYIAKKEGIPQDDAEKLVAMGGVSMFMGAGLTQKQAISKYLSTGGSRKDVESIIRGYKPISVKNRQKIIDLIKAEGPVQTKVVGKGLKLPTGTGLLGKIVMPIILVMMFSQQIGDWFVFFPESVKRILSWVGINADIPIAPPEVLGESKPGPALEIMVDTLTAQGVIGLKHPGTGEPLVLDVANLATVLEALEQQTAALGEPTFLSNVLPKLEQYKIYSRDKTGAAGKALGNAQAAAAAAARADGSTPKSFDSGGTPRTIIRMVQEKAPDQFIGTLFSAKVGDMKSFERNIDDEITDENDLLEDVKINLTSWLASFPGRLGYSVVIRKNPVDEYGTQQSGIWATMTMHMTRLNGTIQPIDTILLGPVSPANRLKLNKSITTVEAQIPKLLTGEVVRQLNIPVGTVDIFDKTGDVATLSPVASAKTLAQEVTNPVPDMNTEPTATQLEARKNPQTVEITLPGSGLFKETDSYGSSIYGRAGNNIYQAELPRDLMTEEQRSNAGNSGAQAARAVQIFEQKYGIQFDSLPEINIGDLNSKLGDKLMWHSTTVQDVIAKVGTQPATQLKDTLN